MSRALLVNDVQREYFEGAFPIRHPVGHLRAILEVMDAVCIAGYMTHVCCDTTARPSISPRVQSGVSVRRDGDS